MEYADDPRNGSEAGKYLLTVSGLNKKKGTEYITRFPDPFKMFRDNLSIPKEFAGRQVATYIDEPIHGIVTDYLGTRAVYDELSALHLEESDYTMSIADDYLDYLLGIQEAEDI